ncbi:hypothetical protein ACWCOT_17390 [Nonomuraea bangladeshensis]
MKMDSSRTVFRLERGVTGFRHVSEPPVPETEPRRCRRAWSAAARRARGQVGDFAEREYPQSFHSATINDRDGAHLALFQAQVPLVAFVSDRRWAYSDEFLDPPAWAVALSPFGFTVLGTSLLMSPLTKVDTTALSAAEWREIEYWKPKTLGELLFNAWD